MRNSSKEVQVMKKSLTILLFLIFVFSPGCITKIPYVYNNENVLYKPNEIRYYLIPAESHVSGYIKSEGKFSAYILTKEELKKLKDGETFKTIKSWKNVNFVKLNITVPNEIYYLVVKNEENKRQWIKVKFKAKR